MSPKCPRESFVPVTTDCWVSLWLFALNMSCVCCVIVTTLSCNPQPPGMLKGHDHRSSLLYKEVGDHLGRLCLARPEWAARSRCTWQSLVSSCSAGCVCVGSFSFQSDDKLLVGKDCLPSPPDCFLAWASAQQRFPGWLAGCKQGVQMTLNTSWRGRRGCLACYYDDELGRDSKQWQELTLHFQSFNHQFCCWKKWVWWVQIVRSIELWKRDLLRCNDLFLSRLPSEICPFLRVRSQVWHRLWLRKIVEKRSLLVCLKVIWGLKLLEKLRIF
jgi:hypothetical protein